MKKKIWDTVPNDIRNENGKYQVYIFGSYWFMHVHKLRLNYSIFELVAFLYMP